MNATEHAVCTVFTKDSTTMCPAVQIFQVPGLSPRQ